MGLHSPVVTIMWFIIFPLCRQQNYWSMLSALWSKAVCGCECAPSSVVANFKLEAFLTRVGWFSAKQLATSYAKKPVYVQRRTHTHTHARSTGTRTHSGLRVAFVDWIMDHPGEWIHPQNRADVMSSQVSVSIINGEMCQSDKAVLEQAEVRWLDTFHFRVFHYPKVKKKKRRFLACCSSIKLHAGTVHNNAAKACKQAGLHCCPWKGCFSWLSLSYSTHTQNHFTRAMPWGLPSHFLPCSLSLSLSFFLPPCQSLSHSLRWRLLPDKQPMMAVSSAPLKAAYLWGTLE